MRIIQELKIYIKKKFPQEVWKGMRCNVTYFKVFYCLACSHMPKELKRKKMTKVKSALFLSNAIFPRHIHYVI